MNDMGLKVEKLIENFERMCVYGNESEKDVADFKAAILTLFKEMVPEEREASGCIENDEVGGWNACRESMLSRIKEKLDAK